MPGLFKGLGPNLMGVFPSRAIYFWTYSTVKRNMDASLPKSNRDTPFVHVISAAAAGTTSPYTRTSDGQKIRGGVSLFTHHPPSCPCAHVST